MTTVAQPPRPSVQPITELTREEVMFFHRYGYLTLSKITTADDIAYIQQLLQGLFDKFDTLPKSLALDLGDVKTHDGKQVTPQINEARSFEARLSETFYFKNAKRIAEQLIGPDATCSWDHAIYKPPHNGKETPWHQDISYPVYYGKLSPERAIRVGCNFWMPLQDTSVEMGCMQFVPSSNHAGVLPHRPIGGDPKVHTLEVDGPLDTSSAVACPVPAGGCTIHGPRTLHFTGPNQSDHWRRAWILFFGSSNVPTI